MHEIHTHILILFIFFEIKKGYVHNVLRDFFSKKKIVVALKTCYDAFQVFKVS